MNSGMDYRQRADEQRIAAREARSPMARLMHKKAADRWSAIADAMDRTGSPAAAEGRSLLGS